MSSFLLLKLIDCLKEEVSKPFIMRVSGPDFLSRVFTPGRFSATNNQ